MLISSLRLGSNGTALGKTEGIHGARHRDDGIGIRMPTSYHTHGERKSDLTIQILGLLPSSLGVERRGGASGGFFCSALRKEILKAFAFRVWGLGSWLGVHVSRVRAQLGAQERTAEKKVSYVGGGWL